MKPADKKIADGLRRDITPDIRALAVAMDDRQHRRADLGRLLGIDASQVTRIFDGRRRVQLHEWRKIERWLGEAITEPPAEVDGVTLLPGMVPLYGWAGAASDDRLTFAKQTMLGTVARHPNQANALGAFALMVQDDSMVPRYEPGEVIYLAPNQWPAREQDCVLVTREGFGYLKRFKTRTGETVKLLQFNPERELVFSVSDIMNMHSVVGRG